MSFYDFLINVNFVLIADVTLLFVVFAVRKFVSEHSTWFC